MTPSELLRACADAIDLVEQHKLGFEPCLSLVWPQGLGLLVIVGLIMLYALYSAVVAHHPLI